MKTQKMLVVYFSHTGQNYANGSIIDLNKGNTEIAAEMIADLTGAELFELRTKEAYPHIYKACTGVAAQELRANARPELAKTIDVSCFDTVILGYPNWCGTMPMAVWTFLEGQDFTGKTILPFCTNEGSGMGVSEQDLKRLCPGADVRPGLPIHGSSVADAKPSLESWLNPYLK